MSVSGNRLKWFNLVTVKSTVSRLPPPKAKPIKQGSYRFLGVKTKKPFDQSVNSCYQSFFNSNHYTPIYFNSNAQNEKIALDHRVVKQTPKIDVEYMKEFVQFVKDNLNKFLTFKKLKSDKFDIYIKNSNSAPSVKKKLIEANRKNIEEGVGETTSFSYNQLYKMTTRKSFVKVECLCYKTICGCLDKAPRLIQGGSAEYVAIVGPFFSAFQRYMKKQLNSNNFVHFTSGSNSRAMGKFTEKFFNNVFENDVSAYDASISKPLCELEVWIAGKFGAARAVTDLMKSNIKTHGYTMNGFKYNVEGTRKSGDPFTSCFNSLLNMMMHIFIFVEQTGVSVEHVKENIKMLVMGDDNLASHSGTEINWAPSFLKLGFVTVSIYQPDIYSSQFCSSVPIPDNDGIVFIPKPGKVLCKLGYFINPPLNEDPKSVLRGVCLGYEVLSKTPLFNGMFNHLLRYTHGSGVYKPKCFEHKFNYSLVKPNLYTIYYICRRYNFSVEQLEEANSDLSWINDTTRSALIRAIIDRDSDGPQEIYTK